MSSNREEFFLLLFTECCFADIFSAALELIILLEFKDVKKLKLQCTEDVCGCRLHGYLVKKVECRAIFQAGRTHKYSYSCITYANMPDNQHVLTLFRYTDL